MAQQRRASAASNRPSAEEPDVAIEVAFRRATERFMRRTPASGEAATLNARADRMLREFFEVGEAFQRVRAEAGDNSRGWDWNLLRVLDWQGDDVGDNERRYRPRLFIERSGGDRDTETASRKQQDRERGARGKRLRALLDAYSKAQSDLEWVMRRSGSHAPEFATVNLAMADLINQAIREHESVEAGIRAIGRIHGKVRRTEHVRVAAILVLSELHRFTGAQWKAEVATFIANRNDQLRPHPCPKFAGDDPLAKIHTMTSRCGL